jgi:signal peptidase II
LKKFFENYSFLVFVAGVIVALDQATKYLVRANLAIEEFWTPWPWLEPYARIVHWKNTGAAFGMLPGFGDVFTILAIIVAIAILYYFPQVPREDWPLRMAMGAQLGGALGNLIDRLTIGYVVDFVSIGNFPVFNVADASITFGVVVLVLGVWIKERSERSHNTKGDLDSIAEKPSERVPEETWGE